MNREAAQGHDVAVSETAPGRIAVSGDLTFATARVARELGLRVLGAARGERLVIDCAAVRRADSAGLAVLLEWLSWGRRRSRVIELDNLPPSLLAIARISEVDGLLRAG